MVLDSPVVEVVVSRAADLLKQGNWADSPEGWHHWASEYNRSLTLEENNAERLALDITTTS